jgi:CheY-like chemotaxis protein
VRTDLVGDPPLGGDDARNGRPRILVVEDDPDLRAALVDLLRRRTDALVMHAASGPDALAHARAEPPDVVVLDAGLPGVDGWAVAAALKADPETRWIRLIGLSGIGPQGRSLALAAGFDDYLGKNCDPASLVAAVRAACGSPAIARRP